MSQTSTSPPLATWPFLKGSDRNVGDRIRPGSASELTRLPFRSAWRPDVCAHFPTCRGDGGEYLRREEIFKDRNRRPLQSLHVIEKDDRKPSKLPLTGNQQNRTTTRHRTRVFKRRNEFLNARCFAGALHRTDDNGHQGIVDGPPEDLLVNAEDIVL